MDSINFQKQIEEVRKREKCPEQRLGSTGSQPFTGTCSGGRKLMWTIHKVQTMPLKKGEAPRIQTSNEKADAEKSSEFICAPDDYVVLRKIDKFENKPGWHYWLIVKNLTGKVQPKGTLDIIERTQYKYTQESYGLPRDNSYIDIYEEGSIIKEGSRIRCPDFIDKYGIPTSGVNLLTGFFANNDTQQDGIKLSETAASKLESMLHDRIKIKINNNDIMLNLYGDYNNYKVIPDIGEDIKDSLFCVIRRQQNNEVLFSQAANRLHKPNISDDKYTISGKLIDLEIIVNDEEKFIASPYNKQLVDYHYNKMRYCSDIVNSVNEFKCQDDYVGMSNDLNMMYDKSMKIITHHQYSDERVFSGNIIIATIKKDLPLSLGDKLSNRYGGKGVTVKIVPDYMMPKLPDGRIIEVENNNATVIGRLNYGVLFEMEINGRVSKLIEMLASNYIDDEFVLDNVYHFLKILSNNLGDQFKIFVDKLDDEGKHQLVDSILDKGFLYLVLLPMSDVITIDVLMKLDEYFSWMKLDYMYSPIINTRGEIRYVKSLRPVMVGDVYYVRLKQYAKEKFSATSNSSVNIRNENSKSNAAKLHKEPHADTPVRIGSMETEDLLHLGVSKVIIFMLLYSHSVSARRNVRKLYNCDPMDFNILLDQNATSRGAEINATYARFLGYRHVFKKELKEYKPLPFKINVEKPLPFTIKEMVKEIPFTIKDNKVTSDAMIVSGYLNDDGTISSEVPKDVKGVTPLPFRIVLKDDENGNQSINVIQG